MNKGFQKYQLADRVLEALPRIGFKMPTEVQEQVIPLILQRRNVMVEAATGTGKTAAYGLPLLSRIDYAKRSTQVLVLAPSRELALQVETALRSFSTDTKLKVASLYGGMSLAESEKRVKSSPHILVAVPGRLKDTLRGGKLDFFWRDIKYLVIDEADKLLEFGFQEILDNLVSHLRNMVQVALFSATISEDVEALVKERFQPLQVVRLSPKEALRNIYFHYIVVDQGQKQRYLAGLIQHQRLLQALIFTPNRDEVYDLAGFLRSMGWKAEAYHGLLDQVERAAIMKRFKSKQVDFLVATDLAARGLDVEGLPTVVNYAFPEDIEIYIHRCGRTGRAGRKGAVYNLVASKKEEILVQSFHEELEIALKGFMIQPMDKNAHRSVEGKLVKAHLNRGKRDNIAAGDIVGFLVNSTGVKADAVGTIAIYAGYALVDMPEWALEVLEMNEDPKLKGKSVKVTQYSLNDQKHRAAALKKSQVGVADKKKLEQRKAIVRAPRSSPEQREGKVAPEPNESVQGGKTGSMRRTKEKAEKGQPEGGKRASGPSSPAARKADPKAKPKPNPRKAKSPVPSKPKPTEAKASGSKKRPSSPRTVKGGKHA
ncbi:MAG: hypothetical protein RLZZ165_678 [Bacteroidota bacterium]